MASNSSRLLLITLLSLALLFNVSAIHSGRKAAGDWQPIDPNDRVAVGMGRFAVDEYNKMISNEGLTFQKVAEGKVQFVNNGFNYQLVIAATSSTSSGSDNYVAVVWSKPEDYFWQLKSFNKI